MRSLGLGVAVMLAAAGAGWGHDGPHQARVLADVVEARTEGREIAVVMRIEALQETLTLVEATAETAETLSDPPAAPIAPGSPLRVVVRLRYADAVPEVFALTLDFGAAGLAAVPVVPDQDGGPVRRARGR